MPRPPSITPNAHLHITINPAIRAQMDLFLYSEVEGRVPQGAHKAFIEMLIREFFERRRPVHEQATLDNLRDLLEPEANERTD